MGRQLSGGGGGGDEDNNGGSGDNSNDRDDNNSSGNNGSDIEDGLGGGYKRHKFFIFENSKVRILLLFFSEILFLKIKKEIKGCQTAP